MLNALDAIVIPIFACLEKNKPHAKGKIMPIKGNLGYGLVGWKNGIVFYQLWGILLLTIVGMCLPLKNMFLGLHYEIQIPNLCGPERTLY